MLNMPLSAHGYVGKMPWIGRISSAHLTNAIFQGTPRAPQWSHVHLSTVRMSAGIVPTDYHGQERVCTELPHTEDGMERGAGPASGIRTMPGR